MKLKTRLVGNLLLALLLAVIIASLAACSTTTTTTPEESLTPTSVPATTAQTTAASTPSRAPDLTSTATPAVSATPSSTGARTIVDIAVADARFKTLVTALQTAALVDTLQGAGPFTVFAPTDDAFNKLPAGTLDNLLKDVPALKNILLYHVASGEYTSAELAGMTTLTTVQGAPLNITSSGGTAMINNAKVIIPDLAASNGVIHVIDAVLIPPTATATSTP